MNLFPRVQAFLTGGEADDAVLRFAARVAGQNQSKNVSVLGVPEDAPLESEAGEFERRVRATLERESGGSLAASLEVRTYPEPSLDDTLKATRDEQPDLLILGRRLPSSQLKRSSLYPRLVRKAPCSVLLVTPYARPPMDRILVPVDFSAHAEMAVSTALEIAREEGGDNGEVLCQHVAPIPYGYRYTGDTAEEFARKQREATEEQFRRFLADAKIDAARTAWRYTVSEDEADAVVDLALAERVGLVVVGSRGLTAAAALIMGSTAEKIVQRCAAPILVVKRKGETVPFLRALLGD